MADHTEWETNTTVEYLLVQGNWIALLIKYQAKWGTHWKHPSNPCWWSTPTGPQWSLWIPCCLLPHPFQLCCGFNDSFHFKKKPIFLYRYWAAFFSSWTQLEFISFVCFFTSAVHHSKPSQSWLLESNGVNFNVDVYHFIYLRNFQKKSPLCTQLLRTLTNKDLNFQSEGCLQ